MERSQEPDQRHARDVATPDDAQYPGGSWLASQPAVRHAANQLRSIRGLPPLQERALVGSGTTGGGAFTPPDMPYRFFDLLAAQSVMLESGIQRWTTSRDSVIIPRLTADASSAWYSEAATITPSDPTAD
jgi:HK97 family phage major capsid protein